MEKKLGQYPSNCIKIVLFGPESTGKTTLSKKLAAHYQTEWVEEYARAYLQKKWDDKKEICTYDDLIPIAEGQMRLENEAIKRVHELLICDTDLLQTKVYSEAYFNCAVYPELHKFAVENAYDLYLLAYIDTPWTPDDLRDKPEEREEMFLRFQKALEHYNRPYLLLKGNLKTRLATAIQAIDQLIP